MKFYQMLNATAILTTERHRIATNAIMIAGTKFPAYDNKAGWKLDKDGKIEMKDGNPVYVDANGGELTMGLDTIARLNGDIRDQRVRAEKAETSLKVFEGLDAEKARKAIDMVSKIDAKKLIDAGEVDKVTENIKSQFTAQLSEKDKAIAALSDDLNGLRVNNIFANSDFIRDRIAVPRDMFEATFRQNFKIDDNGQPQAFDKAGNRLMSRTKAGEYASPDEALQILVEMHPQKDTILKAPDHSGSGNNGQGGGRPGQRTIRRSDFEKLPAHEQASGAALQNKGELVITDN